MQVQILYSYLQLPQSCLHNLESLYSTNRQSVRPTGTSLCCCCRCTVVVVSGCMSVMTNASRVSRLTCTMANLATTAKQVERVESTKEALKACWLALHLLLQSLLPLLLLLALQLLIHWKLLAAYWAGVVLQQQASSISNQCQRIKTWPSMHACMTLLQPSVNHEQYGEILLQAGQGKSCTWPRQPTEHGQHL